MAKGGDFEREISAKFSLWWTNEVRDDIFYRTDGSGGRATTRRKSKKTTAYQDGDMSFTDPIGEPLIKAWNVEMKTGYGKWSFLDKLDSRQKKITFEKFWEQTVEDAVASGREPVLIFRRPRMMPCIVFYKKYVKKLAEHFGKPKIPHIVYIGNGETVVVFSLKDFFTWISNIKEAL